MTNVQIDTAILDKLIADTGGEVVRIVADGVNYGIYQEWGTVKMGAQPFMSQQLRQYVVALCARRRKLLVTHRPSTW